MTSSRMKLNVSVYTDCSGQHHGIHRLDNHLLCLDNMCIYTYDMLKCHMYNLSLRGRV